jgi:hypothetical protein
VRETVNIDIYEDNGYENYCSKANKLRQIWENEKDVTIGKLLDELLNCYENSKMLQMFQLILHRLKNHD